MAMRDALYRVSIIRAQVRTSETGNSANRFASEGYQNTNTLFLRLFTE